MQIYEYHVVIMRSNKSITFGTNPVFFQIIMPYMLSVLSSYTSSHVYSDNIASSHWLSREIDQAIKDKPFHNSTANISKNPLIRIIFIPALFSYQTVVMPYSDSVPNLMNDVCFWLFLNWLLCFILKLCCWCIKKWWKKWVHWFSSPAVKECHDNSSGGGGGIFVCNQICYRHFEYLTLFSYILEFYKSFFLSQKPTKHIVLNFFV